MTSIDTGFNRLNKPLQLVYLTHEDTGSDYWPFYILCCRKTEVSSSLNPEAKPYIPCCRKTKVSSSLNPEAKPFTPTTVKKKGTQRSEQADGNPKRKKVNKRRISVKPDITDQRQNQYDVQIQAFQKSIEELKKELKNCKEREVKDQESPLIKVEVELNRMGEEIKRLKTTLNSDQKKLNQLSQIEDKIETVRQERIFTKFKHDLEQIYRALYKKNLPEDHQKYFSDMANYVNNKFFEFDRFEKETKILVLATIMKLAENHRYTKQFSEGAAYLLIKDSTATLRQRTKFEKKIKDEYKQQLKKLKHNILIMQISKSVSHFLTFVFILGLLYNT